MKSIYSEDKYLPIYVKARQGAPEYLQGTLYQVLGVDNGYILLGKMPCPNPSSWYRTKDFELYNGGEK